MKKMIICPICENYGFYVEKGDSIVCVNDDTGEIEYDCCYTCGWTYDPIQLKNHDVITDRNSMTFNERKVFITAKLENDPNYSLIAELNPPKPHLCPVCEKYTFPCSYSYYICDECGWQDDVLNPDIEETDVNKLCFVEFKNRYLESLKTNKKETTAIVSDNNIKKG